MFAGFVDGLTFHVVRLPSLWLHVNCFPSKCQSMDLSESPHCQRHSGFFVFKSHNTIRPVSKPISSWQTNLNTYLSNTMRVIKQEDVYKSQTKLEHKTKPLSMWFQVHRFKSFLILWLSTSFLCVVLHNYTLTQSTYTWCYLFYTTKLILRCYFVVSIRWGKNRVYIKYFNENLIQINPKEIST